MRAKACTRVLLMQGYWLFGRVVEALADIGYDANTVVSAPYDW